VCKSEIAHRRAEFSYLVAMAKPAGTEGRSSQACPPMPTCSPNANGDDALGLTTIAGEVMADARTGRNGRVPMGTKVWRRRLRINPNVVSEHESVAQ
jgi:hypothetical protein